MNLVEEIGISLWCAFFCTTYLVLLFSPVIFCILYSRNVRKHKKLEKEWEGTTDGHLIATLKKKRKYVKFYFASLIVYIVLYFAFMIFTHFAFLIGAGLILLLMALYAIPWYFLAYALVSFVRFILYRKKEDDTEENVVKERKKRRIIFIISSVVSVIVFILYFTVIFKFASEISFM